MPFLTKTSIKFVSFNLLRLVSVVAIVLALAGSITTLVTDMQGYEAFEKSGSASTSASTSSTRLRARELEGGVVPAHRMMRRKREYIDPASEYSIVGHTTTTSHSSSSATATVAKATATLVAATSTATSASSYIDGTSVPKATGGVVFVAANRIFVCLILLLALGAELPPPTRFTDRFFLFAFPPFSSKFGPSVLGLVQVFLGSDILAKSTAGLTQAAAWLLFIVGFVNLLVGLTFGAALKADRAFIATAAEGRPAGLRSPVLGAEPHAGAESGKYGHAACDMAGSTVGSAVSGSTAKGKKERSYKPIQISAPKPMAQAPAPPVYHPEGRY